MSSFSGGRPFPSTIGPFLDKVDYNLIPEDPGMTKLSNTDDAADGIELIWHEDGGFEAVDHAEPDIYGPPPKFSIPPPPKPDFMSLNPTENCDDYSIEATTKLPDTCDIGFVSVNLI